jgi:hypothetical protein
MTIKTKALTSAKGGALEYVSRLAASDGSGNITNASVLQFKARAGSVLI